MDDTIFSGKTISDCLVYLDRFLNLPYTESSRQALQNGCTYFQSGPLRN